MSGEVENNIDTTDQVVHNEIVSDISTNDLNLIGNPVKIKRVSSLFRQEGIDDDHFHTQLNEAAGKIATDKTHATGNQHGTTVILGMKVVQFWNTDLFSGSARNGS